MPGAHPQRLAAASPVEHVINCDHADQSGAVEIHPRACGCGLDRPAMVQKYGAGGEYHEERRQQHAVVQQSGEAASESGTLAADHQGEGTGFLVGGGLGASICSTGRKMASYW